jgi:CheY-like chemotaxis protein
MNNPLLSGCRILVVEDEYILAQDLRHSLQEAGASVLGPAQSVTAALAILEKEWDVHGAVLDVNLAGELVWPVADALAIRGVPLVFATGAEKEDLPVRFQHATRCGKPVRITDVVNAIGDAMFAFLAPGARRQRLMMAADWKLATK